MPKIALLLLAAASAAVLGAALLSQYGFGLAPCHLCILQRYPYAGVIALALIGAFIARPAHKCFVVLMCALLLLAGAGIATYHAGVEWRFFPGPSDCTSDLSSAQSIEQLKAQIMGTALVQCDQPAFVLLGLSMAGWNALVSLALAAFALVAFRKGKAA